MSFITTIPQSAFVANPELTSFVADRSDLRQYEPIGTTFHMARPGGIDLVFRFRDHLVEEGWTSGWKFTGHDGSTLTIFND